MANGEVLGGSKFHLKIDGMDQLLVKKVSGIGTSLEAAGDTKAFGVSKDAKTAMQATVSGVKNGKVTVVFVATAEDKSMHDWYRDSHAIGGTIAGGGSTKKGERKSASLTVMNQAGQPAAVWTFQGVFPSSYKTSKMEPGSTELFTETVEFVYESCHRTQ